MGKKNCTKNWDRICREGNANKLLLKSCLDESENDWKSSVTKYFLDLGLIFPGTPDPDEQAPCIQVYNRECGMFQEAAFEDLQNSSKLKTLCTLRNNFVCENYLLSVSNIANRTALTKFRLSNHKS
jgi:hypothetical protein